MNQSVQMHFISSEDTNLSRLRPTRCPCSDIIEIAKPIADHPIPKFLFQLPRISTKANSELYRKSEPVLILLTPKFTCFSTRTDVIRKEHDRGKKRKTLQSK